MQEHTYKFAGSELEQWLDRYYTKYGNIQNSSKKEKSL